MATSWCTGRRDRGDISGKAGQDPTLRVKFINNTVQGGGIGAVNAQDVTVANNTISGG